jgi:hypothetical protein
MAMKSEAEVAATLEDLEILLSTDGIDFGDSYESVHGFSEGLRWVLNRADNERQEALNNFKKAAEILRRPPKEAIN